jgi:hypothetical protein
VYRSKAINIQVKFFADAVVEFGCELHVCFGVYIVENMVAILPHVPGDYPLLLDQVESPSMACAPAFEQFVIG